MGHLAQAGQDHFVFVSDGSSFIQDDAHFSFYLAKAAFDVNPGTSEVVLLHGDAKSFRQLF
jgi:hypothetical protein